ncbi:protein unc-119 homolog B-A-like isoform X1 [Artemia franciscana]|uniref:GMP phosphodiesterase delta subunit domain-containing protein n=2 Tax=Artemia franciscana TaxID=6661 RepID=A0AA88IC75_ARTSF|nr:hypothetical protein QYM36_000223 [Artemia franciscana]
MNKHAPSSACIRSGDDKKGDLERTESSIRPELLLSMPDIADRYLCGPEDNIYEIDFTRFVIRDLESGDTLFEIVKPPSDSISSEDDSDTEDPYSGRFVRYHFTPRFLMLRQIGATVDFQVGSKPIQKFRMIERHFFKDIHLKTFDFDFGYCMANSKNSCEHIYEFPSLSPDLIDEMIKHPYETRSDSFYFADDKLIMHNKADYAFDAGISDNTLP